MKTALKKNYENACNAYLKAFCEKHDYDFDDARDRWVAGSVGTITCIADYYVGMEMIRMDIDRDAPVDEFVKWYDYNLTMHSLGATLINYDHWLIGAPRRSDDEIAELKRLHAKAEEEKQPMPYLDLNQTIQNIEHAIEEAIKRGDF